MAFSDLLTIFKHDVSGGILAFLLEEQDLNLTGYKVLQNYKSHGLIRAQKTALNGHLRLVYDTRDYKSMSTLLADMSPGSFAKIAESLLTICLEVESNGFIQDENIILSPDMIFVDPDTSTGYLIYLPINNHYNNTGRLDSIEQELRELLLTTMREYPNVLDATTRRLRNYLSDTTKPLKNAAATLRQAEPPDLQKAEKNTGKKKERQESTKPSHFSDDVVVRLMPRDEGRIAPLTIPPTGGIIGREAGKSHVVLKYPSISRIHCRISLQEGKWIVEDLSSKNGTFYNGRLLNPGTKQPLEDGSTLALSSLKFRVLMESRNGKM